MIETHKEAAKRLARPMLDKGFKPIALHTYTSTDGSPLYYRIRCKHPDTAEKWIRPMKFIGQGYELGEPKFPDGKPLYALHRLTSNPDAVVWIAEGEPKVDALNKLGLVATTSGGATSADGADFNPLRGRTCRIWPDNDDPGKAYAGEVANILLGMGCTVSCIDVDKLGLGIGEDVIEWLAAHPEATGGDIEALPMLAANSPARAEHRPEPLPALPDVLPFDDAYLPDGLRAYVQDISERMQCPPDFAAVAVFVMMATIIGRKVGMRPMRQNDWTVIVNLWGAVVGNSGVMKSPTLSAGLAPVKQLQAWAYEEFNKKMADHAAQDGVAKLQATMAKAEAKAKLKKDKTADIADLLKPSAIEDEPTLKRYITNNASYEALGELLIENPNGLLVESDEIIGLLKQLDASGQEVARSFYLTAADGDKGYTFDRILRGKGLHIPALCLSIVGGIQPGVLAEYVRQATNGGAGADGLLQRFGLMVYPDISPDWQEVDRYPDTEAREAVNQLAERLDYLDPAMVGAETDKYGGVPFLRFDYAAQVLFSEWRAKLETRLRSGEEHPAIVSHLSKYRKLIPSLALINHLCDDGRGAVTKTALLRAIAFSEYLESHARRIYSYATRPDIDAAKTLLNKLSTEKLATPFKTRDIYRAGWTGLETPAKAQSAISLLQEYGHLTAEELDTGGRSTTEFHWIKEGMA
ncbi:MAG: DUF3987 domain-containing protein [Rugosibacter sp.]|nr:MAG: DUF3987 domain-containing protein [Rugosibacter sp.]